MELLVSGSQTHQTITNPALTKHCMGKEVQGGLWQKVHEARTS